MDLVHLDEIRRQRPVDPEARERVEELKRQMLEVVQEDQAPDESARE